VNRLKKRGKPKPVDQYWGLSLIVLKSLSNFGGQGGERGRKNKRTPVEIREWTIRGKKKKNQVGKHQKGFFFRQVGGEKNYAQEKIKKGSAAGSKGANGSCRRETKHSGGGLPHDGL